MTKPRTPGLFGYRLSLDGDWEREQGREGAPSFYLNYFVLGLLQTIHRIGQPHWEK